MDQDLFRNTLATNALSTGKPTRNPKPRRPIVILLLLLSAYLLYHFT